MALRRSDALSLVALGLAAVATLIVYDQLPIRMATHFDIDGKANGWMPRAVGAWFGPVFGVVVWAAVRFLPSVLPVKRQRRVDLGANALVACFTALLLVYVHVLLLRVAIVSGASLMQPIWIGVGALVAALGLVLPRVRRNAFIGVRTAWTLASDENWARTHRVAGYAMVIGGALTAVVGVFGGRTASVLAIISILASALVPAIYSAVLARRQV